MKLDRNLNPDGLGKYELKNLRTGQVITDCGVGEEHEFFVIMLKDSCAQAAEFRLGDAEWSDEVREMARRSGPASPFCKVPD